MNELLRRNREYVAGRGPCTVPGARPALAVAILTCMDARIDPVRMLGIKEGDAHVLRNAGATVTNDVLRSLVVSQHALGTTEIMLIKHADCGLRSSRGGELRNQVEATTGTRPPFRLGTFPDVDAAVREDVRLLKESPLLVSKENVRGFVYDESSGKLREVV